LRQSVPHIKQPGGVLPGLFGKGAEAAATGIYAEKAGVDVDV